MKYSTRKTNFKEVNFFLKSDYYDYNDDYYDYCDYDDYDGDNCEDDYDNDDRSSNDVKGHSLASSKMPSE